MRIATFALPVLFLSVGCGGRVAGGDVYENAGDEAAETTTKTDRLEILRQRCALPRKSAFESEAPATTTLLEGRWLRCPSDRDPSFPMAYVVSFEAIEIDADGRYFRLAVVPNGFERRTSDLGDTGAWSLLPDGRIAFELPSCSEGRISSGYSTKCGGFDALLPIVETSPTRMHFYGEPYSFVKDE